jgi:RimJ/RimL family protein N-acetyltransferase
VLIETERLVLRKPRLEDAQAFLPLHTDPVAMEFIGGVHPDSEADPEFPLRVWLERWELDGFGRLVVERRADGVLVGRSGLVVWDTRDWHISSLCEAESHGQPELGWAFAREHWGHGYATEAALAVREWARTLVSGRLVSVVAPANVRSRRVVEKLGCTAGETVVLADSGPAVVWEHPR